MKLLPFIFILFFLCWTSSAHAQIQGQGAQAGPSLPEQWQLTLDVIKSKAQHLMVENNGLQGEYQQLVRHLQELREAIDVQDHKNQQAREYLAQRHGQSDQQLRIDELTQRIKTKNQQADELDEQLANLQSKESFLNSKIQSLKLTISGLELHQQAKVVEVARPKPAEIQPDSQLIQLRKQIEDESRQEVLLENKLADLKNNKTPGVDVAVIDSANKQLEARLDELRLQKLQRDRASSAAQLSQAKAREFEELKKRKDELEFDISSYASRMDELKESSLMALTWSLKKKKLVHQMVQEDARNNQMRYQIKVLNEDIGVLKDQIARLERRVDFVQGKGR